MELDLQVGELLQKLDDLGVARDTIVLFTADNGAMVTWWPVLAWLVAWLAVWLAQGAPRPSAAMPAAASR